MASGTDYHPPSGLENPRGNQQEARNQTGLVAHACNPSTQSELQNETLSQNENKKLDQPRFVEAKLEVSGARESLSKSGGGGMRNSLAPQG